MYISDLAIRRPILVSMALSVFLIFGLLSYFALDLDLVPDVDIPYVTVTTVYPGSSPEEIETQITKKIEDAVATISQIDWIRSYSMESVAITMIRFDLGKDGDVANQEVKDKIDLILDDFADDAELPIVEKFDIQAEPIMDILLTGTMEMKDLYDVADRQLKDLISQVQGVAKVDLVGGSEREIRIALDNRVVFQNAVSLNQLAEILKIENMDVPGGHFQQRSQEYTARFSGKLNSLETIRRLEVPTAFGKKQLGDLAEISDTASEVRTRTTFFDNQEGLKKDRAILLTVTKSPDGNTVRLAQDVKEALPEIQAQLPAGCLLTLVTDKSIFIKSSVDDTMTNLLLGIILTGAVLLFFLHDLRSTFIVAMAMPYSIISTFLLMAISGFSMNIMSLMGLSTAVGVLVANSVVVIENIFRHRALGLGRSQAAGKGTTEIAVAVIASTMTNIVVFLPIASMTSIAGQFFKEFALTVTYATIFSLLVSFTLTPMLASLILPKNPRRPGILSRALEALFSSWERAYAGILRVVLASRWGSASVVLVSIVVLFSSFQFAGKIGSEFMPVLDEGDINIEVELPQGYNLDETAALVRAIEERIKEFEEVRHILTTLGEIGETDVGTNLAQVKVKLVDPDARLYSSSEMSSLMIHALADVPNADIRVAAISQIGRGDAPVQLFLLGQELDQLEVYTHTLLERLGDVEGLVNLSTSFRPGKPEITLIPDRRKIADAGLAVMDLAFALRAALEGVVATRYKEDGEEYDIRVTLKDQSVDTPEEIGQIAVAGPDGVYRMSQLAQVHFAEGQSKILHKDKAKCIEFTGYTAPGVSLSDVVAQMQAKIDALDLREGYRADWGGDIEMMNETTADMIRTFLIAVVLTYMLLAAILESLTQPLMIMATIPLALVGVFASLLITGKTLSLFAMMAIIMLIGIVVNNAILILDYANLLRKQGQTIKQALVEACPTKLKPILMSTIAIILGMLPMALGIGSAGREFRQPMGIVSIGGLIVSSVLTLLVIPAVYHLFSRDKRSAERATGEKEAA